MKKYVLLYVSKMKVSKEIPNVAKVIGKTGSAT